MSPVLLLFLVLQLEWSAEGTSTTRPEIPCQIVGSTVNCQGLQLASVPHPLPNTTVSLRLCHNQLQELRNNSFQGLSSLVDLQVCYNQVEFVEEDTFAGLGCLQTLDLSNNNINALRKEVFFPLKSLQRLDLSWNGLLEIPKGISALASLQYVRLSRNNISSINLDVFRELHHIQEIILDNNPVLYITAEDLRIVKQLKIEHLSITGTVPTLAQIQDGALSRLKSIKKLDLSGIKIGTRQDFRRHLSELKNGTVTSLYLVHVSLGTPEKETLDCLPKSLETLNLEDNEIRMLKNDIFAGLPNLKELAFGLNPISTIENKAFDGLEKLEVLDLILNDLTFLNQEVFLPISLTLQKLDLGGNDLRVQPGNFQELQNLESLNLENNGITILKHSHFQGLRNLKELNIDDNAALFSSYSGTFQHIPRLNKLYSRWNIAGDSLENILKTIPASLQVIDFTGCRFHLDSKLDFVPQKSLQRLIIRKVDIVGSLSPITYPFLSWTFHNLTELEWLDMALNHFSVVPMEALWHLRKLTHLDLHGNSLGSLHAKTFRDLESLEFLDLSSNKIYSINPRLLWPMTSLRVLNLTRNFVSTVNAPTVLFFHSLYLLDLSHNPFSCTCDLLDFVEWIKNTTSVRIQNLVSRTPYSCFSPEERRNLPLLDLDLDCDLHTAYYMCIVTSTLVFLYTIAAFLLGKYHPYLQYCFLYLRGKARGYKAIPRRNQRILYDAFVSYNCESLRWVQNHLIPNLEERRPHYRLCIADRDFIGGRDIVDNITDGILQSRKTVCLLTRRFIRSGWCTLEFKIARHRLFDEGKDVLILVLLENIPVTQLSRYHLLQKLMSKKTYLVWPQDTPGRVLFWERLRQALGSRNELPQGQEVEDDLV
ncbi:PREDICTED: toll-like receptor 13 [Branchiostoma belcheri]|uniref:Toll-like receptor 13 n=1 Tax=Branchiostoma belcheri TaxID=7741 RepID=A0A6P4Z2K6_BRABE|nr:PREDICTED: toll-like receptor 13 [Branchiostoma belcheri]